MKAKIVTVGVFLLALSVYMSARMPAAKAQATTDPCSAPWDVVAGTEQQGGNAGDEGSGWHAVKWNRCTGEAFIFSADSHRPDAQGMWRKLPVK